MILWHCANARSFRPLWLLEEMQLPYQLKLLPFPPRKLAPEYLGINPLGTIPYFQDGDKILTESSAILVYLAQKHGPTPLQVESHEADYAQYLNFLFQSDATFTFPQTLVLRYRLLEPPERRQPEVADSYAKWFLARMEWVETHLSTPTLSSGLREWLVGGRFTIADIAVGYAVLLASQLQLDKALGPHTLAWWARCMARDGYQRAQSAQNNTK